MDLLIEGGIRDLSKKVSGKMRFHFRSYLPNLKYKQTNKQTKLEAGGRNISDRKWRLTFCFLAVQMDVRLHLQEVNCLLCSLPSFLTPAKATIAAQH